jgi:ATP-dependent helicase Lhr and Lhr-like helicase
MSNYGFNSLGFHPIIEHWFQNRFEAPSPPQKSGWPSIAAGNHTLILAPTGSGKTLAAFLWSIDQLFRKSLKMDAREFDHNPSGIHTLYISPLKALNNDIHQNLKTPLNEIERYAKQDGLQTAPIRMAIRTGDTPSYVRRSMLHKPPHILITTPESFYLLLTSARGRQLFHTLKYVIVDEIHALCNNKRGVHLSLSLERMVPLCQNEPIRIGLSATQKPLDRIAAYLGGQSYCNNKDKPSPRPVEIIDCGWRKHMDLKVITPVPSFRELPESSVWQPVYRLLYKLIQAHNTTLIFAGMRSQTEKIARELNRLHQQIAGETETQLALAHHGSISRDARYAIEDRLKSGNIPAVVATASLELGIDIGSIDLVVHLQAPKNVTGALQRIGRSGHLLSATSKGRIIVLYPADLDDAVAITHCMHTGDIEETRIPENALDVLAQQITAEVAVKTWDYQELYHLVRLSYCYRNLPASAFKNVVEMLSGRLLGSPLQALKPRLNWDRINNHLIARRGSRLAAVMNGGTIPDRGYYGVYLENTNIKLGEVEEEFVFESRVTEAFFLGNSEWLIKQITADRVIVTPFAAINPRAPFWKGDILHREYSTSKKIGRFRKKIIDKIHSGQAQKWLLNKFSVDKNTAVNLVDYFIRQQKKGQLIATDKQVVAESTIDSGGEPLLILHTVFGARVNGAWAIALSSALEQQYQTRIQYSYDDDGILIRLPDSSEPPPYDWLFSLSAQKIEQFLMAALPLSPVFQVHFRYNAARSLMLTRSSPGKRIPLWLQRLRASDLLQTVGKHTEFPVVIETYRECLQDIFDLTGLKTIIAKLDKGHIRLQQVDTALPSPMAASILFKFVSVHLYELDHSRQTGEGPNISSELINSILDQHTIPALVTSDLVTHAQRRWQHLDPMFQASSREDLFSIIEKLGPIDDENLIRRCKWDPSAWLGELKAAHRIVSFESHRRDKIHRQWRINESHSDTYTDDDRLNISRKLEMYLQVHGPVSIELLSADLMISQTTIDSALKNLQLQKKVVSGKLMDGSKEVQWCDRHNFTQLYRMAVARRRSVQHPADRAVFNRFLFQWHKLSKPGQSLKKLIRRYRGFRFPLYFFEQEILRSRYHDKSESAFVTGLKLFDELISNGEIIVHPGRVNDTGNRYVEFRMRGEGHLLADQEAQMAAAGKLGASAKVVFDFLTENGASYGRDLQWAKGLNLKALNQALQQLADRGLVSCENYQSFAKIFQSRMTAKEANPRLLLPRDDTHRPMPGRRPRRQTRKSDIRKMIQDHSRIADGRWFLTNSLPIMGKPVEYQKKAELQAHLLLQRYGILIKEWYRREHGLLPWNHIFQVLKRMEWQGEIRRGYFVAGLSGIQFALPEALELLQKITCRPADRKTRPILLNSLDPALPFGGGIDWGVFDSDGNPQKVKRSASNHLVFTNDKIILLCEGYFKRLIVLDDFPRHLWKKLAQMFRDYLKMPYPLRPKNRIEIQQINNHPAAASPHADNLLKTGFEKDGTNLVLWSSTI